jgi:hypothetical protein
LQNDAHPCARSHGDLFSRVLHLDAKRERFLAQLCLEVRGVAAQRGGEALQRALVQELARADLRDLNITPEEVLHGSGVVGGPAPPRPPRIAPLPAPRYPPHLAERRPMPPNFALAPDAEALRVRMGMALEDVWNEAFRHHEFVDAYVARRGREWQAAMAAAERRAEENVAAAGAANNNNAHKPVFDDLCVAAVLLCSVLVLFGASCASGLLTGAGSLQAAPPSLQCVAVAAVCTLCVTGPLLLFACGGCEASFFISLASGAALHLAAVLAAPVALAQTPPALLWFATTAAYCSTASLTALVYAAFALVEGARFDQRREGFWSFSFASIVALAPWHLAVAHSYSGGWVGAPAQRQLQQAVVYCAGGACAALSLWAQLTFLARDFPERWSRVLLAAFAGLLAAATVCALALLGLDGLAASSEAPPSTWLPLLTFSIIFHALLLCVRERFGEAIGRGLLARI